jgi:hypothetical protein
MSLKEVSAQLQLIFNKMSALENRLGGLEEKMQKKTKLKTKGTRDVSKIHIFSYNPSDEFVKVALIDNNHMKKEVYPVIEFQQIDFKKLGNLILNQEMKSIQWTAFNTCESVAKYENNQFVLV